jgi:hypothetical protein
LICFLASDGSNHFSCCWFHEVTLAALIFFVQSGFFKLFRYFVYLSACAIFAQNATVGRYGNSSNSQVSGLVCFIFSEFSLSLRYSFVLVSKTESQFSISNLSSEDIFSRIASETEDCFKFQFLDNSSSIQYLSASSWIYSLVIL